ncbi:hypothetical protein M378DRAFT_185437 [Amanita muscaria Koide BX008]|uniref:F-actin-capping protein subunit alpha n=1 Tax=Amanita muscaria (strain Koide BX008) TaxID=946122 RepID=A0A0C2XG44_AMAMK|nr:hypothetical protein M378DRAFT_185437 [Amanita muscaria Koide BX008]
MDEPRAQVAAQFLLQSPPGEINDVLNDIRTIIADDDLLQEESLPVLKKYNLEQFITVDVPNNNHQSIISAAAKVSSALDEEERFLDPRSKTTFAFDHISLEASEPLPIEIDAESEPFRASLESATLTYLSSHYYDGVTSVFAIPGNPKQFNIQVVANKYNPTNYWSGRWRAQYDIDMENNSVVGKISVNVHYYEQGNVQLATTHDVSFNLPQGIIGSQESAAASKILALIGEEESNYQQSLANSYHDMGEKTFKGLRRALPLTRQKFEWDRVTGYKLGAELSSSKGLFTNSS